MYVDRPNTVLLRNNNKSQGETIQSSSTKAKYLSMG